jgi:hypothetical protein
MSTTERPAPSISDAERKVWRLIRALTEAESNGLAPPARGGWCAMGVFVSQVLHACALSRYALAEDALCEIADSVPAEAYPMFAEAFTAISRAAIVGAEPPTA